MWLQEILTLKHFEFVLKAGCDPHKGPKFEECLSKLRDQQYFRMSAAKKSLKIK